MHSTTILNMQLGGLWRLMLIQLDDPRVEKPFLVLKFGEGKEASSEDQFEFKLEAIKMFREVANDLLARTFELGALQAESVEQLTDQVEMAIQHTTQIMH